MILTNKHNLPDSIVKLVKPRAKDPDYPDTRVSVTDLLGSPRKAMLARRYGNQIEEDVIDRVWLLFGNFAHYVLEQTAPEDAIVEEKIEVEFNGLTVVGKSDSLHNSQIDDYKTTTVWSKILDKHEGWKEQVNLYACLWRLKGREITSARIVVLYRDWRMGESFKYKGEYPAPIEVIDIPLLGFEAQKERLVKLTNKWKDNIGVPDNELTPCTKEEKFESDSKWAVWDRKKYENKTRNSRALKICNSEVDAIKWIKNTLRAKFIAGAKAKKKLQVIYKLRESDSLRDEEKAIELYAEFQKEQEEYADIKYLNYVIEYRAGERVGCERYCPVKKFCNQYAEESNT